MSVAPGDAVSLAELQLAARNHGMPLEALRHDVTPIGLHYVLVHYDIPIVDPATYRLAVVGRVKHELSLSLADLQRLPAVTRRVTLECAGNGRARLDPRPVSQPWLLEAVGTAEWTGVPLSTVLDGADVAPDAIEVAFTGADRGVEAGIEQSYTRALTLDDARADGVLLAYALNGQPLPPQHGFPLRLVVPGWYGMASVKWLAAIEVRDAPFTGHQQATAYRFRASADDPGTPVTRMEPRALLVPPGIPDFMTRRRFVRPGPTAIEGRAWSGHGAIANVDVSTDAGATWSPAELEPPTDPAAWTRFHTTWNAEPGEHELRCRARDATGREQPAEPAWNLGGYANTAVQRVPVTVRP